MASTREEIRRLKNAGLTVREMANVLGITTQAVYLHLKALGLSQPKNGKKRTA